MVFYLMLTNKVWIIDIGRGILNALLDDGQLMFLMMFWRSEAFFNTTPLRSQLLLFRVTKLFTYKHPNNLVRQLKPRLYLKLGKEKFPSKIISLSSINDTLKGLNTTLLNYSLIFKSNSLLWQLSRISFIFYFCANFRGAKLKKPLNSNPIIFFTTSYKF